jgi:glyoxylate/hydroxypyruvate reductase A
MIPALADADRIPVLIASWLDQRHIDRIAASEPERIALMYEPDLLPTPRYEADHHGTPRQLTDERRDHWRQLLAHAEVAFDFDWERPNELLERAPRLRWVQATSSGIGPLVEQLRLARSPIRVTNAAGIHAQPLAEFVLMAALYFAKDMPRVAHWRKERHWEQYCAHELAGSRLVLIGLGKVGSRIAELCSALDIEVIGHRKTMVGDRPSGVRQIVDSPGLDGALREADLLVIAVPESPETLNLVDRRRLGLLPAHAVLINVGRGSVVDEEALIEMLEAGRLRGAALDVFAREPLPPDSRLWAMTNVIISPHSASTVLQENDRLVDLFIQNLRRYLDRRPLINEFDHVHKY